MAAGYQSSSSTYVPSFAASGKIQVEFSRNPKKFAINRYIKQIPVKQDSGYYLKITTDEAARITQVNLAQSLWPDGAAANPGDDFRAEHEFPKYKTQRHLTAFSLGDKAVEQADWEIIASYSRMAAQLRMTERTQKVVTALTDTANWGTNYETCTNLVGGKLDVSTTTLNYIKELNQVVANNIHLATGGAVSWEDMIMVMNPLTAAKISRSAEFVEHLIQSPFALAQVRGDAPNQNMKWGLPEQLFGMKVEIEDAVKVTSRKGATRAASYILDTGTIYYVSRPEGLIGSEGVPSFATLGLFVYEDMTVETKKDADNRRTAGRVVDDFGVEFLAPATGFLVTAATETT